MMQEVSVIKEVQKEQTQILQSLEEGIILMKKNELAFTNQIFDQILKKEGEETLNRELLMDKKIFRVYRNDNEAEKEEHSVNLRSMSNTKSLKSEQD